MGAIAKGEIVTRLQVILAFKKLTFTSAEGKGTVTPEIWTNQMFQTRTSDPNRVDSGCIDVSVLIKLWKKLILMDIKGVQIIREKCSCATAVEALCRQKKKPLESAKVPEFKGFCGVWALFTLYQLLDAKE